MAIITIDTYYRVQDAKGNTSTVTISLPGTVALADVNGFIDATAALIDSLINGKITDCGYTVNVDLPAGLSAIANAFSDVQEKARFAFRSVNRFLKAVGIPTFSETKYLANSALVDQADVSVAAFVTMMEDGITVNGHVVQPCDIRGEDIATLESAVEAWGKARG